jgi:hypothetical protein
VDSRPRVAEEGGDSGQSEEADILDLGRTHRGTLDLDISLFLLGSCYLDRQIVNVGIVNLHRIYSV